MNYFQAVDLFRTAAQRPEIRLSERNKTMHAAPIRTLLGIALLISLFAGDATGQTVKVGGLAYVDYFYRLGDDDESALWQKPKDNLWDTDRDVTINDVLHGFTYRRVYLTTDATISEKFKARFRLEANDKHAGSKGPIPFVKDMWVDWNYTGNHSARAGIMPPPAFQLSEHVWEFRSLEKTILDVQGVNSSRDFGIRFDGPIPIRNGLVRYAVMLANGGGNRAEHDKNKRGYAQISIHPSDKLVFSVGADYGKYLNQFSLDGEVFRSPPYREVRASVFGGYEGDVARFGVEAFLYELKRKEEQTRTVRRENEAGYIETSTYEPSTRLSGVSVFGSVKINPLVELVGRLDLTKDDGDFGAIDAYDRILDETLVLVGVAFTPNKHVRIIPNLWWFGSDYQEEDEREFSGKGKNRMGRVTIEVSF